MTSCPPATRRFEANAYLWVLAGDAAGPLAPYLERFPALEGLEGVRVLKSNHFRTVFHVPGPAPGLVPGLAEGGLLAKVYRYTSRWDRLRYRLLPHRAEQEWRALRRFAELGLPTARALAVAEERREGRLVGGGLFAEFLAGTAPLAERLHDLCSGPGRGEGAAPLPAAAIGLLEGAGRLVRAMHDRGVAHRDLHAGNILVEAGGASLRLIDLHTCVFRRSIGRRRRRAGVSKLLHSLRRSVPAAGLAALVEAYGPEALVPGADAARALEDLLEDVEAIQRKRQKSRSKRCFLPSTQFAVERSPGVRLYHLREVPAEALEPLWTRDPPGRVLKAARRGWVAAAGLGPRRVLVKHRRYGLLEGIQSLFESHALRRAYGGGHALAVRGIPTPRVVALREVRRLGMAREAHIVTELVEDGEPLDEHLFREYWGKPAHGARALRKHAIVRAAGRLVRALHDAGLFPHDLSPQNLLVSRGKLEAAERAARRASGCAAAEPAARRAAGCGVAAEPAAGGRE
ncbi:MAG: hypothetical protein HY721_28040, partial [Planctomycetes bacterium]|nr:hypothetical protein [Planctomycetota bacterium]